MTRSTFLARLALLVPMAACGATGRPAGRPPSASTQAAQPSAGRFAPTPYTARQLREATQVGRRYVFDVEAQGEAPRQQMVTFTEVNDDGLESQSVVRDERGAELKPPKKIKATWEELRKHAEFPREAVTLGEEMVALPAGIFDCVVYTVRKGEGPADEISRFYFAKSLPGAPVFFTTDKAGVRVFTQKLVEHHPGGAS